MKKKNIITPAALLSTLLFLGLFINFIPVLWNFPLKESHQDYSSHMARIQFLRDYGFDIVPNWYEGFYPFKAYYFGYYVFALPFFLATGSLTSTIFLTVLSIYLLALLFCNIFYKNHPYFLFTFFFFNPIMLFDVLNLGRLPEFFGWMIFVMLAGLIFRYKDRKIDLFFVICYAIVSGVLMIGNTMIYILSLSLLAGLFLIRKEKAMIAGSFLLSIVLMSWWLIPLLSSHAAQTIGSFYGKDYVISEFFNSDLLSIKNWYHDLAVVAFIFMIWVRKDRKETLFFLPASILAVLYLLKITYFLPFLKIFYHLVYVQFFWMLFLYLFLKTDILMLTPLKRGTSLAFLYHIIIPSILYVFLLSNVHSFQHTSLDAEIELLSGNVNGKFVVVSDYPGINYHTPVSYITITKNLTTPMGWVDQNADPAVLDYNERLTAAVLDGDCNAESLLQERDVPYLLTFGDSCKKMLACGFTAVAQTEHGCVISGT